MLEKVELIFRYYTKDIQKRKSKKIQLFEKKVIMFNLVKQNLLLNYLVRCNLKLLQ